MAGCAALMLTQATTPTTLLMAAMFYAFFADAASLAMAVYTPEVYPVKIRGKGAALAMGWGRFGGMIAPIVAGFLISGQNLFYVWCLMAVFQFRAVGLTLFLVYETRGENLEIVSRAA